MKMLLLISAAALALLLFAILRRKKQSPPPAPEAFVCPYCNEHSCDCHKESDLHP